MNRRHLSNPEGGAVQGTTARSGQADGDELAQGRVDPRLLFAARLIPIATTPAPAVQAVRRFYLAIPFSPRGRPGPPGAAAEVALTDIPEPPANMTVANDPATVVVVWEPSGGLVGFLLDREIPMEPPPFDEPTPAATPGDPPVTPKGPTLYNVYVEVAPDPLVLPAPVPKAGAWQATLPAPANPLPLAALMLTQRWFGANVLQRASVAAAEASHRRGVCATIDDSAASRLRRGVAGEGGSV